MKSLPWYVFRSLTLGSKELEVGLYAAIQFHWLRQNISPVHYSPAKAACSDKMKDRKHEISQIS